MGVKRSRVIMQTQTHTYTYIGWWVNVRMSVSVRMSVRMRVSVRMSVRQGECEHEG